MKPGAFAYHRPETVAQALDLLAAHDNARVLAGGQSLMPMMNMRLVAFDHLIDINRIPALSEVEIAGDTARIGAMARQAALMDHAELGKRVPILKEALSNVGHLPTRTRGTIGGSLAHLDPSAELPGIAVLHDAQIVLRGPKGERRVAAVDFAVDYLTPDIAPGELLVRIELPLWPAGHGWSFVEFAQRHGDFALVGVGVLLTATSRITRAAIVLTGVGKGPVRLSDAEDALVGAPLSDDTWSKAAEFTQALEPIDDPHASTEYRRRLARTLVERALKIAAGRIGASA